MANFTVGIEGQYIISFTIGHKSKPVPEVNILPTNLYKFTVIDETGNLLPTWEISFIADEKWEPIWDEGITIDATFSRSTKEIPSSVYKLMIVSKRTQVFGQAVYYWAAGVARFPAFTQTPHLHSWSKTNGTSLLQEIAKYNKFNVVNEDSVTSQESQSWHQANTTDKKFLDYVVQHCYIPKSFVGVGINASDYLIVDVSKQTKKKPKYVLSFKKEHDSLGKRYVPVLNPKVTSPSAFLNAQSAYGVDTPIWNIDFGTQLLYHPEVDLSLSEGLAPNVEEVHRKVSTPIYTSQSEDPNFIAARCNYSLGMALLSMEVATATVIGEYFPLKLYDPIYIFPIDLRNKSPNTTDSGKYLVSKIGRTVVAGKLETTIQGCRNNHN